VAGRRGERSCALLRHRTTATTPSCRPQISLDDVAAWEQLKLEGSGNGGRSGRSSPQPPATPPSDGEERLTLDWKGDPIKFNPGDKLPFKFL
jgi:hypothetical protein